MKPETCTISICIIMLILFTSQSHALQPSISEGTKLIYRGAIRGVPQGGVNTWEETITIDTYNNSALVFERKVQDKTYEYMIAYEDGIPTFVDYPANLIYLPPESLAMSLNQEVDWALNIRTSQGHMIENVTAQRMNFTVELGTFECINITLALVGMDYGRFSYLYDVESGILVYEQWIPLPYGDIVAYGLVDVQLNVGTFSAQNLILPTVSCGIPILTLIHQSFLKYKNRKNRIPGDTLIKNLRQKKASVILLLGAVFCLSSVLLPWSQISSSGVYLLFSFPATLGSYIFLPVTLNYEIISLSAFASAILAWLGVSLMLYLKKRLISTLATILSIICAFVTIFLFIQTKWTANLGLQILAIGTILEIAGTVAENVRIELAPKESTWNETQIPTLPDQKLSEKDETDSS